MTPCALPKVIPRFGATGIAIFEAMPEPDQRRILAWFKRARAGAIRIDEVNCDLVSFHHPDRFPFQIEVFLT